MSKMKTEGFPKHSNRLSSLVVNNLSNVNMNKLEDSRKKTKNHTHFHK